jgi:hypothetical protein
LNRFKSKCRTCCNDINKENYYKDIEKSRKRVREYYKENRQKLIVKSREWRERNPQRAKQHLRKAHLKPYGITPEEFDLLLSKQKGVCAICNRTVVSTREYPTLVVDHDHQTNKIRGLLCRACNIGLGHFEDNVLYLQAAIRYLLGEY